MIDYIEKGHRMIVALFAADLGIVATGDGTLFIHKGTATDDEINTFISNYDPLPEAKADARSRVTVQASKLVADIYPFVNPDKGEAIGLYHFTTDLYLSIKAASRNALSGRLLDFKGIYDTAQAKIAEVNVLADWQEVDAYDATIGW